MAPGRRQGPQRPCGAQPHPYHSGGSARSPTPWPQLMSTAPFEGDEVADHNWLLSCNLSKADRLPTLPRLGHTKLTRPPRGIGIIRTLRGSAATVGTWARRVGGEKSRVIRRGAVADLEFPCAPLRGSRSGEVRLPSSNADTHGVSVERCGETFDSRRLDEDGRCPFGHRPFSHAGYRSEEPRRIGRSPRPRRGYEPRSLRARALPACQQTRQPRMRPNGRTGGHPRPLLEFRLRSEWRLQKEGPAPPWQASP